LTICDFIADVQHPAARPPSDSEFWSKKRPGLPDIEFLRQHFSREGRITEDQATKILAAATELLRKEPNVLEVEAPLTGKLPVLSV
jgi:serine/threonine-protein phosphatase 2B catalytic subunit